MSFYADWRAAGGTPVAHFSSMREPSPNLRIVLALACTAASLVVCACTGQNSDGGGGSPTGPSSPPGAGSRVIYSAVGASDVIGFGSSKVCLPFEDCNGNGYVWVAARQLRSQGVVVEVQALAIPTGVISRPFQDLGARYGREIFGNFLQSLVPFVKREADVVTVFAGANDANTIVAALGGGAGGSNPTAYVDQMVSTFGTDFAALVAGVRERAPGARIIALNLPNLGAMPYLASASLAQKQAAQRASVRMATMVINAHPGTTVVDVLCDPRLYQSAHLSADGYHPSDAGYAVLGNEIAAAIQSASYPAPRASCPQMAVF